MKFSDVIGQGELKAMLARGIDSGRISHAQMFTGECGYGTLPLALAYAQYANCTARADGDSCGVCPSCRKMEQLAHPDLHFVFPVNSSTKSGQQKPLSDAFLPQWRETVRETGGYFDEQRWYADIEIENQQGLITRNEANEIIRKLSFKSFEARYKIMLIWLPERMRTEAANTLLKILEEPWERTLFIMVSAAPQTLLPTILSRVQQIAVPGITPEDMAAYFTGEYSLEPEQATRLAHLAQGDLCAGRVMLERESAEADASTGVYFDMFARLMRLSYGNRHMELLEWGEVAAQMGREQQKRFLKYAVGMLRDSYMIGAGMTDIAYLRGEELEFGKKFSPFIGNYNIEPLAAEMERAIAQITQNGNPRIIFPHMALSVSKLIGR